MSFQPIHKHLLINAVINKPITSVKIGKLFLSTLVEVIGMVPVTKPQAVYVKAPGNEGLTGSINLATSHIAFHVWDKTKLLMLDVYSCKEFETDDIIDFIEVSFDGIKFAKFMTIDRERLQDKPLVEHYITIN